MAKQIQASVSYWRNIWGRISRLGDSADDEGHGSAASHTPGTTIGLVPAYDYQYLSADNVAWKGRTLFEIDLSAIPRNSYIQSCILRMRRKAFNSVNWAAGGEITSLTLAMYKAEAKPWDQAAVMAKYDGTNDWYGQGMYPDEDYYAVSALRSDIITKAAFTADTVQEFDLTAFAREAMDRNDQKMRVVWKPEEVFEIASLWGHFFQGYGSNGPQTPIIEYYGPTETSVPRRPYAVIVYTPPMAFYASQEDGTIDESREIFLGAGQARIGSVVYSAQETTYQETPAKLFVKNQLTSMTMKSVEIASPPNWATYPEPDAANTGNGSSSDVSTSPSLTIDEQWKIEFTSATGFTVYRDGGTGDDPAQEQTWTEDGTGTVGTLYSSATRGISFTITAGGAAFVSGDKFSFRTYKDYSIVGASTDADYLLQVCKDASGSPDGNWYHARPAMTTLTQQVVGSNLLNVALAKYFNPANKVKIFKHATRSWTSEYTIQSVNKTANTITLVESVSAEAGDWVHIVRLNLGDIPAGSAVPIWLRGVSFTDSEKEEKYQYLAAKEAL
jgi:hypothetical protein